MSTLNPSPFKPLALFLNLLLTLSVGGISGYFTASQVKTWYPSLHKPIFNPPNWLFGPVWSVLYIIIGIAAYLVWQHRGNNPFYPKARLFYFSQLALNFMWSFVFFGFHQILLALLIILTLEVCIILTILNFNKIYRLSAWLLVPYLAWVSFATLLNFSIYLLNK